MIYFWIAHVTAVKHSQSLTIKQVLAHLWFYLWELRCDQNSRNIYNLSNSFSQSFPRHTPQRKRAKLNRANSNTSMCGLCFLNIYSIDVLLDRSTLCPSEGQRAMSCRCLTPRLWCSHSVPVQLEQPKRLELRFK